MRDSAFFFAVWAAIAGWILAILGWMRAFMLMRESDLEASRNRTKVN